MGEAAGRPYRPKAATLLVTTAAEDSLQESHMEVNHRASGALMNV